MQDAGVGRLVFSSTCATYGMPEAIPMDETHVQLPINPYGRSKLIVEQMLGDLDQYSGFRSVVLRYFNAAGADPEGRIGEWHTPETHAIPLAIEAALGRRAGFKVFGSDYDTRDGTCVRDFVHVMDLADAHSSAVRYLLDGGDSVALNLGTGDGTTVSELLATIERVSGRRFPVEYVERRDGDSPALVADNAKAKAVLGWAPALRSRRDRRDGLELAFAHESGRHTATLPDPLAPPQPVEGTTQWHFSAFEPGARNATATPTSTGCAGCSNRLSISAPKWSARETALRDRYEKVTADAAFSQQGLEDGRAGDGTSSKIDDMTGTMIRYTKRMASLQSQIDFVTEIGRKVEAFSQANAEDRAVA